MSVAQTEEEQLLGFSSCFPFHSSSSSVWVCLSVDVWVRRSAFCKAMGMGTAGAAGAAARVHPSAHLPPITCGEPTSCHHRHAAEWGAVVEARAAVGASSESLPSSLLGNIFDL